MFIGLVCVSVFFTVLFVKGGVWVGKKFLPWFGWLSNITFCVDIIIFVPLAFIKTTRSWAGVGFLLSSYVFGITVWFLGIIWTYMICGIFGVIIGLLLLGIGVVPMAILATLFRGFWLPLLILIVMITLTFGLRILGVLLIEDSKKYKKQFKPINMTPLSKNPELEYEEGTPFDDEK